MVLCRRKTDGAIFRPSHPDDYCHGQAMADAILGNLRFYFRGVRWQPRRWWQIRGRWIDTGEIWESESGEFDVIRQPGKETDK
jgi:hypothetical protein